MTERMPSSPDNVPAGMIDPASSFANAIAGFDAGVPHPLGQWEANVAGRPIGSQPEIPAITVPGVQDGQIIGPSAETPGTALAPLRSPGETTIAAPLLQPETSVAPEVLPAVQHVGALATRAAAGKQGSKSGRKALKIAQQAKTTANNTNKTVGKIAKKLGIQPAGTKKKKKQGPLKSLPYQPIDWGYSRRKPFGHDPYNHVVDDPTVPGGKKLVEVAGRISSTDRPRMLNPWGTNYEYYGIPEWQRIKNATAKGGPKWGPSEASRQGRGAWGTDRWPFWQHMGFRLRKLGTNVIPGGWIGDGWRGRRNRLVDPSSDFYTAAEAAKDKTGKIRAGQLRTRVVGRRTFKAPGGARFPQDIKVSRKSGEKRRGYYPRNPSASRPSSNRSF